jgi:long-chain fatty acid transport protein
MKKIASLLTLMLIPVICSASGYALYEMNARAHGMAHAYIARVDDPSAIWYNPAALTRIKGTEVYGSVTWINTGGDFTPDLTGIKIDAVEGNHFPPNFYVAHEMSDNWRLGVGFYTPFGLRTEWPEASLPAFVSQKADLKAFYLTPSVAYKINPYLSVGGGFDIVWSDVELERNVSLAPLAPAVLFNRIKADGTDFGFNLGALIETSSNLNFAFTYKSKVDVDYDGTVEFTSVPPQFTTFFPNGDASVKLPLPAQFMVGASTTYEKFSIEADIIYTFWDQLDSIPVNFAINTPVLPDTSIIRNFDNGWSFRLGVEYSLNDNMRLRGGYLFDETPAPDQAIDPVLPDGTRNGVTFGFGYVAEGWSFDIGYMALFQDDRTSPLNNFVTPPGNRIAAGTYNQNANLLAFGFGYKF